MYTPAKHSHPEPPATTKWFRILLIVCAAIMFAMFIGFFDFNIFSLIVMSQQKENGWLLELYFWLFLIGLIISQVVIGGAGLYSTVCLLIGSIVLSGMALIIGNCFVAITANAITVLGFSQTMKIVGFVHVMFIILFVFAWFVSICSFILYKQYSIPKKYIKDNPQEWGVEGHSSVTTRL